MKKNPLKYLPDFKNPKITGNPSLGLLAITSPLRSTIMLRGPNIVSPKRINIKRNSEKPRVTSEKANSRVLNPVTIKAVSLRKLVTSTRILSKKQRSIRLKRSIKDTSPSEILKESNTESSKTTLSLKNYLKAPFLQAKPKIKIQELLEHPEKTFDCNFLFRY